MSNHTAVSHSPFVQISGPSVVSETSMNDSSRWPVALRAVVTALALGASASAMAAEPPTAPLKADPVAGEKIASTVCAACHGADGNGTAPVNPKLAGQGVDYLVRQLHDFKPAAGTNKAARPNPVMSGIVTALSDQDMLNVAAYYAAKPLKPSAAKDKDLALAGRDIYRAGIADKGVPACAACHGPTGVGIPSQYPRLAGQYADYTEAQLVAFRGGARANNPVMTTIAARLSDHEIKALADYMAGLR